MESGSAKAPSANSSDAGSRRPGSSITGDAVLSDCTVTGCKHLTSSAPRLLPLPIWQKFAAVGDDHAIALGIFFFCNIDFKIDGAHDAIAK